MWAKKFLLQGYKVIRIEQKSGQKKNVEREVGVYLSTGTILDPFLLDSNQSNYLYSIFQFSPKNNKEDDKNANNRGNDNHPNKNEHNESKGKNNDDNIYYTSNLFKKEEDKKLYGVSIVDVSVGEIYMGWFWDDSHLTILQTLTLQFQPKEILYQPQNLSSNTLHLLKNTNNPSLVFTALSDYWDSKKTFSFLLSPFLQNQPSLHHLVSNKIDTSSFHSFQSSYWPNFYSFPSLLSSLVKNAQNGNLGFLSFFLF